MPLTPEEKVFELHGIAQPLVKELFSLVKGEAIEKSPIMAELSRRMAIYAARGDKAGMDLVTGRIAAEIQDSKLEAEASFGRMLGIAGAFLLDIADGFLPRLIGELEGKLLGKLE